MPRPQKSEAGMALGVIAFSALALWQALAIPVSPVYAQVGPTAMALASSGLLMVLGLALLAQALRGDWALGDDNHLHHLQARALLWLLAGLLLNVSLIGWLGFIPASALLFACVARAFGSRRPGRDLLVGIAFAAVAYFGFARALSINIGTGSLWEKLLP